MNALIAFADAPDTKKAAEIIAEELKSRSIKTKIESISAAKEKTKLKEKIKTKENKNQKNNKEKKQKNKTLKLNPCTTDWSSFDLVFLGTPAVVLSTPKEMNFYLKECTNVKGKKIGVFVTYVGLYGNALKKMSGTINFVGGKVHDSLVISSFLGFNQKKIESIKDFVQKFV